MPRGGYTSGRGGSRRQRRAALVRRGRQRARPSCSCTAGSATRASGSRSSRSSPSGSARSAPTSASSAARPGRPCPWSWQDDVDRRARRARHRARGARRPLARRQARARHRARAPGAAVGRRRRRAGARRPRRRRRTPRSTRPRYDAAEDEGSRRCWRSTSRSGLRSAPTSGSASSGARRPTRTRCRTASSRSTRRAPRRRSGSASSPCPTLVVTAAHDPRGLPRDRPARGERGAGRAPRRARLRPLRDATRARALSGVLLEFLTATAPERVAHRREQQRERAADPSDDPAGSRTAPDRQLPTAIAATACRSSSSPRACGRRCARRGRCCRARPGSGPPRHGSWMQCATPRSVSRAWMNG